MKTNKQHQVIMLPTENKSNFYILIGNRNQQLYLSKDNIVRDMLQQNQHLYIISDEKIKEGDWCLQIHKTNKNVPINVVKYRDFGEGSFYFKKIIATTDTSLLIKNVITDLIQGTKYLPQPTQEWVEHYIKEYNEGNIITEVNVEYEWNGGRAGDYKEVLKISKDNTITIYPIKDSWTREEVKQLLIKISCDLAQSDRFTYYTEERANNWIKENL